MSVIRIINGRRYVLISDGWILDNLLFVTHVISIAIAKADESQTDVITIDGVACSFTSDATPTKEEVSNGLIAAIAASTVKDKFTVSQGTGPNFDITLYPRQSTNPVVSVSANLTKVSTNDVPIVGRVLS